MSELAFCTRRSTSLIAIAQTAGAPSVTNALDQKTVRAAVSKANLANGNKCNELRGRAAAALKV
jgi:hypothetical protein